MISSRLSSPLSSRTERSLRLRSKMWRTIAAFRLIDYQTPIAPVIAERHDAAHPEPLLLGGGNLVADALAGHFALELSEGEQHIERQPPHRAGGIELLGHRHERHAVGVEDLDHLGEVGERAGQPVDLVYHHYIDQLVTNVVQQALQCWAKVRNSSISTRTHAFR